MKVAVYRLLRGRHTPPLSALPRLEPPCVLDHPHGEGERRDFSRLHPGRTGGPLNMPTSSVSHAECDGSGLG
jgi:hypothetical protein